MTDNELILAISNVIEPVKKDIQDMKEDLQGVKEDLQGVKEDLQGVKADIQDMKGRIKKIEITQETDILPPLNTIMACYTSTFDRYKDSVETYEAMKQDISILKITVSKHSEILQKLA